VCHCKLLFVLCVQNRELLEDARAVNCYRDELDIVNEKVSAFVVVLRLNYNYFNPHL